MTRCNGLLQRRIAIAVVAVNFELLQINRQLPKSKMRHTARREIERRAALRLGPVHVIGMLVSHGGDRSESGNQEIRKNIWKMVLGFAGSRLNFQHGWLV